MKSGDIKKEVFDGVLLATGHHSYPYIPDFPEMKSFKGSIIHTHSLKKAAGYEDKTVLIIGIGNSAVDAAVEISTVAKQVCFSCSFFILECINFQRFVSILYILKNNFRRETSIIEFYAFIHVESVNEDNLSQITFLLWKLEKLLEKFKTCKVTKFIGI